MIKHIDWLVLISANKPTSVLKGILNSVYDVTLKRIFTVYTSLISGQVGRLIDRRPRRVRRQCKQCLSMLFSNWSEVLTVLVEYSEDDVNDVRVQVDVRDRARHVAQGRLVNGRARDVVERERRVHVIYVVQKVKEIEIVVFCYANPMITETVILKHS